MSWNDRFERHESIREIQNGLEAKQFSVVELTKSYLKVAKPNPQNSFLVFCEGEALQAAKYADELLAKSGKIPRETQPLFGIPVAVKDNIAVEGSVTTCASKILTGYIPPYTATAVQRLKAAGALVLGKTNMDEFGMGGSNENSAFGAVLHPTHPDRVPGGSSGGSAAAVRAGHCVSALGSDTGGSIRLPSSYCGIVGIKPTYGRVSRYGLVAFGSSLDQIGPLARTVEDAALVLDAISGHDPRDSTSVPRQTSGFHLAALKEPDWKNLRVGVPKEYQVGGMQPEVEKSIEDSLRWMESKGAKLVPLSLPHTRHSVAVYYLIAVSEASSNLARFDGVRFGNRPEACEHAKDLSDFYRQVRQQFGPEVKRRIILGTFALASGYYDAYYKRASQVRRLIRGDFDRAFESVDLIAGPVAPTTAFKIGEKISDPLQMYLNDIFTVPANLAGIPAISIPCGKDQAGLPIGLQLTAPAFGEAVMISAAASFERAHPEARGNA
jgi:aspartyl-tRNA(Asn)/glutamyl-tRNA(Gln) amidotransferase subunit A